MAIVSARVDIELQPGQTDGVELLEGDPRARRHSVLEQRDGSHFLAVGIFECEPARTRFRLEHHEVVHVLEGEVEITLDDGSHVALAAGDVAVLPKGHLSEWWFKSRFRELAILTS